MTQPNIVEGDYNTDFDYGTIDGSQTQSPFATSGPEEVNFIFIFTYLQKRVLHIFGKREPARFYPRKQWYEKTKTQSFR